MNLTSILLSWLSILFLSEEYHLEYFEGKKVLIEPPKFEFFSVGEKKRKTEKMADGKFPIKIGKSLSILSLGTIIEKYQTSSQYLWPVGFKSERKAISWDDPDLKVTYTNEIIDRGKFHKCKQ